MELNIMQTHFPRKEDYIPKYYLINAKNKTLGRVATLATKFLQGKGDVNYTPGIDHGNYVLIINSNKFIVSGKKLKQKLYYRNSQRPGNLKKETLDNLRRRKPNAVLEACIRGMLPKGVLGRIYFRRLYLYNIESVNVLKKYRLPFITVLE